MAGKAASTTLNGLFGTRAFAAQASVATKKKSGQSDNISLVKQDAKTTTLPNGMAVYSVENNSPISRIGVCFKAGPRYETPYKLGVSHALRNAVGLATGKSSYFGITRNLEYVGANLSASCDRENFIVELQCNRDTLNQNFDFLSHVTTNPLFQPWELSSVKDRMKIDIAEFNKQPFAVLLDALHKASFRGGLSNSIISPDFMAGKHNQKMLMDYFHETISTGRASVIGLGVDHAALLDYVHRLFQIADGKGASEGLSKYTGGELFIDAPLPVTYAAVVAEGASLKNQKEMLSLALLQQLLGTGPHSKYSDFGFTSKLGKAAFKNTTNPFAVTSLNINYSDTGLFGFCVAGAPDDMGQIVKGVVGEMREVSKKAPSAADLAIAKHKLKASLHIAGESSSALLVDAATQLLATGQFTTAGDADSAIDAITAQDIASISSKIVKGRPAMAAVGRLHNTPHLDELI